MSSKSKQSRRLRKSLGLLRSKSFIAILFFLLGGMISPTVQYWGMSLLDLFYPPKITVSLRSILLTKGISEPLAHCKLTFRIHNFDGTDRTIQLRNLGSVNQNTTVDFEPEAFRVKGHDIHVDSLSFLSAGFTELFRVLPTLSDQLWCVSYLVGGSGEPTDKLFDENTISRLSFFLMPTDTVDIGEPKGTLKEYTQHVEEYHTDEHGKQFVVHHQANLLVYPQERVLVGVDSNFDGVVDFFIGGESEAEDTLKYPAAMVREVIIDYSYYSERESGFLIGTLLDIERPDSVLYHIIGGSNYEQMYAVFQSFIDRDILYAQQFIYLEFAD